MYCWRDKITTDNVKKDDLLDMLQEQMKKSRKQRQATYSALNIGDTQFFKDLSQVYENDEKKTKVNGLTALFNDFINFIKSSEFNDSKFKQYFSCMSECVSPSGVVMALYFNNKEDQAIELIKSNKIFVQKVLIRAFMEGFNPFEFHDEYRKLLGSKDKEDFIEHQINTFYTMNKVLLMEEAIPVKHDDLMARKNKVKV